MDPISFFFVVVVVKKRLKLDSLLYRKNLLIKFSSMNNFLEKEIMPEQEILIPNTVSRPSASCRSK